MNSTKIDLKKLIEGKSTYPSWSTDSVYRLKIKESGGSSLVYYELKNNRKISRVFPKYIRLTSRFIYTLGILKGEVLIL